MSLKKSILKLIVNCILQTLSRRMYNHFNYVTLRTLVNKIIKEMLIREILHCTHSHVECKILLNTLINALRTLVNIILKRES